MIDARRLIEDNLPIEAISAEASREKSVRKGHISTPDQWWARRPLVTCRAAGYRHVVEAVIQFDLPWIEAPQGDLQWAANVLIVADHLPEDALHLNS